MSSGTTEARLEVPRPVSFNRLIFRALMSLASATLLIRVVGMGNQIVVTSHFGAGAIMDAYIVAASLPLLMGTLLVDAIRGSVVPVYARLRTDATQELGSAFFSTFLNLLAIGAAALTLVMLLFRRHVLLLMAPALDARRMALALELAPFIFPTLVLTVAIGLLECLLNTEGQFAWPAYAGALVPLSSSIVVLVAAKHLGILALCVGVLVGLALQSGICVVRLRRVKLVYRPTIDLRHPALTAIVVAALPILLGGLIDQASPVIDQIFASFLSGGSISALSYALKLISVPVGVMFASLGRAALPYLSHQAAAADMPAFKGTLRLYLWAVGIGATALSVLMVVLAQPLVRILFQRGAFTAEQTDLTARTLTGFAIGLTPMAFGFLISKAFLALGKLRILVYIAVLTVIANAALDYVFARLWQSFGIALATSAVYLLSTILLLAALRRLIGRLGLFAPPPEALEWLHTISARRVHVWRCWR